MADEGRFPLHVVVGSAVGAAEAVQSAIVAEETGFQDVWVAEDYFLTGSVPIAGAILGTTKRLRVSTGVASVFSRHPALLAMDASTLSNAFGQRFRLGIGRGSLPWLRQMGLTRSETSVLQFKERATILRKLLAGEKVDYDGEHFRLAEIALEYPSPDLKLVFGFWGPKMMSVANELADAAVISVLVGPEYVRQAAERLNRIEDITTFVIFHVNDSREAAHAKVREYLAFALSLEPRALLEPSGLADEVSEFISTRGTTDLARDMPSHWVDALAVAGTPDECVDKIHKLRSAGSRSIGLFPIPGTEAVDLIRRAGDRILPAFN